jgi:hypothetical protein
MEQLSKSGHRKPARRRSAKNQRRAEGESLEETRRDQGFDRRALLLLGTSLDRGLETTLAEYFGVNRSTICRDKEALLAE